MLFNSIEFLFFFITVTTLYYVLPQRNRWFMLLMASCYFYMAFVPVYIFILLFTIVIDYFAGIAIEKVSQAYKKQVLIVSLCANIGILALFKYYNFINDNISQFTGLLQIANHLPYLDMILPIGLSFHTFQAMSYTIEVYRGHQKAERHFGIYSLYVMFYPQMVAGPIERPQNLLHQLHAHHTFHWAAVITGLKLMLWGFFKKIVIADRLSIYVDAVYNNAEHHTGTSLLIATVFFAFQIYCDFSGYSDIAIGAAKTLGIDLMTNFKRPYLAKSVAEFWSRWHISLSTWFKDYVYISMGGNRVTIPRWYFNLFFVFLLSGLWHGANWTFIIWGALNGMYLIFAIEKNRRFNMPSFVANNTLFKFSEILITFLLICLSWIFFRADQTETGFLIIRKIFTQQGSVFFDLNLIYGISAILFLMLFEYIQEKKLITWQWMNHRNMLVRYSSFALLAISIVAFGVFNGSRFIYFQF